MALELELENYLIPIPGPVSAGKDLRYTPVYDQIKEAKRADDQLERGEWKTTLKGSDWPLVEKICSQALIRQSKDLQIAIWLTEALLHEQGFTGLEFGLNLLSQFMTRFWDTLHPQIEDDDLEYRAGALTYLNEKLPDAVYNVPLSDPEQARGYSFYAWEESLTVGPEDGLDPKQKELRQQMIASGKASPEDIAAAVKKSSIIFYRHLHEKLAGCREQLQRLDDLVTRRFASDPPGFGRLATALEACGRIVDKIYAEKQKSEIPESFKEIHKNMDNTTEDNKIWDDRAWQDSDPGDIDYISRFNAINDISATEQALWEKVAAKAGNGHLKDSLDRLMAAVALAPSIRQKNRYLLLVAKLCLRAGRYDLAKPIAENLNTLIETLKLEQWEHPAWIADVIETLYQCLEKDGGEDKRVKQLFEKLCTLNITKAAAHRLQT